MSSCNDPSCDYCGLPLPQPLWNKTSRSGSPAYCCFGCRFAASVTSERGDEGESRWLLTRLGIALFLSMNVMVFTLVLWSYDAYAIEASQPISAALAGLLRSLCLLLSMPVLFLLGKPILESAVAETRRGIISTALLVLAGVVAAIAYSVVSVMRGHGATYFEVGCTVLVMITLGRWLEASGRLRATTALDDLQRLLPETFCRKQSTELSTVRLDEIQLDDLLIVRAAERIPTDGVLVDGNTTIDEQFITGESWPVTKQVGDSLTGGSLNLDATICLRVTARPSEGTLARLIAAVRAARYAKGRYQRLADRIAGWFLPVIAVVAAATLIAHSVTAGWGTGLMAALSVVLVACPCALGLATPLAVWSGLEVAARRRVIFRSGEALERLAEVRAVRFDKTGTLTTGHPRVLRCLTDGIIPLDTVERLAVALSATSRHVFSEAICAHARGERIPVKIARSTTRPGLGIIGQLRVSAEPDDKAFTEVALGSERLMEEMGFALPERLRSELDQEQTAGRPVVLIGWSGKVHGLFAFEESLRQQARTTLSDCRDRGLDVGVLTGDHAGRGRRIADELDVAVDAALLPESKSDSIRAAQQRWGCVVMVGDGVNDAPALAVADVGIAMGCGTDVTRDSADVCLMGDDLTLIPWSIDLSCQAVKTIRQNLVWAFGYNSVGVVIAAFGWLHPAIAAGLMLVSSVAVIANSLKLSRFDVVPAIEERHGGARGQSEPIEPGDGLANDPTREIPIGAVVEGRS